MAKNKKYTVKYRRRREGKTDYKLRLGLIKSGKIRVVVRKGINNLLVQFVEYIPSGDKVLVGAYTRELSRDYGWKAHRGNTSASYLVGFLAGLKAKKCKISDVVVDFGVYSIVKGSALFAVIKGLIDAGLNINCDESMFPTNERITGKATIDNISKLDKQKLDKLYGVYKKNGLNVSDLVKHFEEVKNKINIKWQQ